jgi:predicted DNA-binding ribbon-helix-helix protein
MQSTIVKHSVVIDGHRTSVSLEDAFWKALREIARLRQMTLSGLIETIDADRKEGNLSSAIRLFVLEQYQDQIGAVVVGTLSSSRKSPRINRRR